MYIDSLTLASLVVVAAATAAFVYSCLFRNCLTHNGHGQHTDSGAAQ